MTNTINAVAGYRLSDAQMEALSRFSWREAGRPIKRGMRVTVGTQRVLTRLGLLDDRGTYGLLFLTAEGRRVVSELPEWDWS